MPTIVDDQVELLFTRTATQSCTVQPRAKTFAPPPTVLPAATSAWLVLDNLRQLMECQSKVSSCLLHPQSAGLFGTGRGRVA